MTTALLRRGAGAGALPTNGSGVVPIAEAGNSYNNIVGTTAGVVVKSGAGMLHSLTINKPVASAVITLFDNTAASGPKIGTITLPATLTSDTDFMLYDVAFSTGLTISVATGSTDLTVSYR